MNMYFFLKKNYIYFEGKKKKTWFVKKSDIFL